MYLMNPYNNSSLIWQYEVFQVINDSICTAVGPAEVDLLLYVDGNRSSVRDLLVFEDHGCLAGTQIPCFVNCFFGLEISAPWPFQNPKPR